MDELTTEILKLKVEQLEKDQADSQELVKLLTRTINEFDTFKKQFKEGNGIVPKIVSGVIKEFNERFELHKKEIAKLVSRIPCSKLIGKNCDFRIIGKNDSIPEGFKELK